MIPLIGLFRALPVGTLLLEACTPRAGELQALVRLPRDVRVGIGVVNQKHAAIETSAAILAKARKAIRLFGPERSC